MSRLIILTGNSGAGKTTMANHLQRRGRGLIVNVGDIVWDVVTSKGLLPRSRPEAGVLFMKVFGPAELATRLAERVKCSRKLIIDGLRVPEVWKVLVRGAAVCSHVHLEVPEEVR
jgi:adenylate kinase